MKKNQLSRDQRRRAKLAKRRPDSGGFGPRSQNRSISGKYRKARFAEPVYYTELGILVSYVMTQKRLTDDMVREGIKRLIARLDAGSVQFPPIDDPDLFDSPEPANFLIWNIGDQWRRLYARGARLAIKDLIGILRTVLDSVDVWATGAKDSRGYLTYLEGFMEKLGVHVTAENGADDDGNDARNAAVGQGRVAGTFESGEDVHRALNAVNSFIGRGRHSRSN